MPRRVRKWRNWPNSLKIGRSHPRLGRRPICCRTRPSIGQGRRQGLANSAPGLRASPMFDTGTPSDPAQDFCRSCSSLRRPRVVMGRLWRKDPHAQSSLCVFPSKISLGAGAGGGEILEHFSNTSPASEKRPRTSVLRNYSKHAPRRMLCVIFARRPPISTKSCQDLADS